MFPTINKTRIFLKFTEMDLRINRGAYLSTYFQKFFNPDKIVLYSTFLAVWFPQANKLFLISMVVIGMVLVEVPKYIIGYLDEKKWGLWKKQIEYQHKKEHLNPLQIEMRETMIEVCKKLGIEHKFKGLEEG